MQLSFARGDQPVEVELVEQPSTLRPQDVFVTLPPQQAFHRLLGLDESRLLRACGGLYSLGQRFSNWSGASDPFLHAYDTHGVSLSHVEFFHYWLKARASGLNVPLEDFSLGAVAAKQGRFVVFNESNRAFSNATYGYHLGAIQYLQAIGKAGLKAGLRHTVADVKSVNHDKGLIQSIGLDNGATIEADLFIDASGSEGRLIRHLEKHNFESWKQWLPCDRVMVASAPTLSPVPAFAQVSAFSGGWVGVHPLVDRTAIVAAFSSAHTKSDDVPGIMSALTGLRIQDDAVVAAVVPGCRQQQWIGNCIAVGETGLNLEPLDGVQLHMLHTGLSYLVSLFPVDRHNMIEAEIYNEKMQATASCLKDFQIAHYALNRRYGEPFWDEVREQQPPDTLATKIALFENRGIVSMREHETFHEENWTSVFIGHGLNPKSWDPLVDKTPEQEQIANFQRILKFIGTEVESMPSLQAHMELNAPSGGDYIF